MITYHEPGNILNIRNPKTRTFIIRSPYVSNSTEPGILHVCLILKQSYKVVIFNPFKKLKTRRTQEALKPAQGYTVETGEAMTEILVY